PHENEPRLRLRGAARRRQGPDPGGLYGLTSADIYDPRTKSFAPAADMSDPRDRFTLTRLADGTVLAPGGTTRSTRSPSPRRSCTIPTPARRIKRRGSTEVGERHSRRTGAIHIHFNGDVNSAWNQVGVQIA